MNTLIFVSGCIVCIDGIDETSVNLWLPIKHSPDQWARKQRTLWEYIKLDSNPLISKDTDLSGTLLVDEANIAGQNVKVAR